MIHHMRRMSPSPLRRVKRLWAAERIEFFSDIADL
jgi:hypothetical protein